MKFSRAVSRVNWWGGEKTAQPFDPADSPRELHRTLAGKATNLILNYSGCKIQAKSTEIIFKI
jgi:hypothetical protein